VDTADDLRIAGCANGVVVRRPRLFCSQDRSSSEKHCAKVKRRAGITRIAPRADSQWRAYWIFQSDRVEGKPETLSERLWLSACFLLPCSVQVCIIAAWENRRIASPVRRPREKFSDLRPIQGTIGRSSRISHVIGMSRSCSADGAQPERECQSAPSFRLLIAGHLASRRKNPQLKMPKGIDSLRILRSAHFGPWLVENR
jgi:hypothetical protein